MKKDDIVSVVTNGKDVYLFMRGTVQPDPADIVAGKADPVDIGPQQVVAVKMPDPGTLLDVGAMLVMASLDHVRQCHGCAASLARLICDVDDFMDPPTGGAAG